jgi:ferric-dicitrate binding protein FerR (iron transport regulator)
MSKQELTSLLQQYLSKDITPAQKQALATLIANATDEKQLRASLDEIWNEYQPQEALSTQHSEAYYNRILQQIKQQPGAGTITTKAILPVHRVHFLQRSWVRIAVAATVVIVAGIIIFNLLPSRSGKQPVASTNKPATNKDLNRYITLSDGSKVLLHAGSQLVYPPAFNGPNREVTLTGEAYFDVAHNAAQPFIIHSGNIKTTVLGTAFNIKAWPTEKEVTVTVTRGKVRVENETGVLGIITPDQQLSFNTQNKQTKQLTVNAEDELSWKNQEYTMDNVTLGEAITELQMRYSIIMEAGNNENTGNCRFTASFKQDESLEYVMNVICKIYQASWKNVDGKIVITNINCNE